MDLVLNFSCSEILRLCNKNFANVLLGQGQNRQLTAKYFAWNLYLHLSWLYSGNVAESDIVDFVGHKTLIKGNTTVK